MVPWSDPSWHFLCSYQWLYPAGLLLPLCAYGPSGLFQLHNSMILWPTVSLEWKSHSRDGSLYLSPTVPPTEALWLRTWSLWLVKPSSLTLEKSHLHPELHESRDILLLCVLNAMYRKTQAMVHNSFVVAISIRFSHGLCTYSKHVLFYNAEHKRLVL